MQWIVFGLSLLWIQVVFANAAFKMEMQNYTDAPLKVYCKSISGQRVWVFPKGSVVVPPRSSLVEEVHLSQTGASHEEIQCQYSGRESAQQKNLAQGFNGASSIHTNVVENRHLPLQVKESITDSVSVDPSFGGVLKLVISPIVAKQVATERVLETRAEFMVSFEGQDI